MCETCGGVWLDAVEADVLMRRMKQPVFPGGTPAWLARIAEALDRLHDVVQPRALRAPDLPD